MEGPLVNVILTQPKICYFKVELRDEGNHLIAEGIESDLPEVALLDGLKKICEQETPQVYNLVMPKNYSWQDLQDYLNDI